MPCPALVYLRVNGNKFVPLGKLKKFHQKAPLKRKDAHSIRYFIKEFSFFFLNSITEISFSRTLSQLSSAINNQMRLLN